MSRSYKHTPVIKCSGYGKFGKQQANKKVRKVGELGHKSQSFKRVYETWNIPYTLGDISMHGTNEELIAFVEKLRGQSTYKRKS